MEIEEIAEQLDSGSFDNDAAESFVDAKADGSLQSEQALKYREFSNRCVLQEIAVVVTLLLCFGLTYLLSHVFGIEYGSFLHSKILYAVFVCFNVYAAGQAFYSWAVVSNKSVARDYMFFWAVAFIGAAVGNSIDFAIWAGEMGPFKQNMLTNLIFVFALMLSFPGIHFLAQVCQVKFNRQPILYYLLFVITFTLIPALMNHEIVKSIIHADSLKKLTEIPSLKEFVFGVFYSMVGGYLTAVSLFIWQAGKGRLVSSARLIAIGATFFSFGCSIYAGLFPSTPLQNIPGNPVHLLIALGYVLIALGLRRTENTIRVLLSLDSDELPPAVTLTEIFGESEGLVVYNRLENKIKATIVELNQSREENQLKEEEIDQLEHEIALRKKVENDLLIAKEKAEEASRAKSEFLAMMSHELKTPLTAIKGYSALLTGKALQKILEENRVASIAGEIEASSNHLAMMVNDLLEFSQLESGEFGYEREVFALSDILQYVRSISRAHQRAIGCKYSENIPDESIRVNANRQALQHIVSNLIINAFKFCDNTSVFLEIYKSAADLKIVVSDQGIGISEEHQEKIFEAFYQVSLGTRRKFGGIGLGLSIVKKLVNGFDGSIDLESAPGKGSRFEVTLPAVIS